MQPHQQRVVDEQIELQDKITKLNNFMHIGENFFKFCDEDEQIRLIRQYNAMCAYNDVLKERIANFK